MLPLNLKSDMYFMQDGAPTHFSLPVTNYLNIHFPDHWLDHGNEMSWPALCLDFNTVDKTSYLRRHNKYSRKITAKNCKCPTIISNRKFFSTSGGHLINKSRNPLKSMEAISNICYQRQISFLLIIIV